MGKPAVASDPAECEQAWNRQGGGCIRNDIPGKIRYVDFMFCDSLLIS